MAHPLLSELQRRVDRLSTVFDLDALEVYGGDVERIRRYYQDSRLGYRFVHSRDGAMHLALNPSGNFDRSGYRHQPSLVLERIADSAVNVLELACGNGYNLGLLAERKPSPESISSLVRLIVPMPVWVRSPMQLRASEIFRISLSPTIHRMSCLLSRVFAMPPIFNGRLVRYTECCAPVVFSLS